MWYLYIAVFSIVILSIILYNYLYGVTSFITKENEKEGPLPLSKSSQLSSTDIAQSFLTGNTGSIRFFVNIQPIQKTGQATSCSLNPGDPECSTERYNICSCVGKDCSKCDHKGYYTIANVSNVLKLDVLSSPDASRPGQASAHLSIKTFGRPTNSDSDKTSIESFVLPPIAFQKWVCVTIAREGRRFDIYYDSSLVLSKRTQYSLDHASVGSSIQSGDERLFGEIAFFKYFPERLSIQKVASEYKKVTDTNGAPVFSTNYAALKAINICPNGNCIKAVTVRPASPLYDWDTEYD